MLDLILVWASIDGALGALVAELRGISWAETADSVGRTRGSAKFQEAIRELKKHSKSQEPARKLKRIKKRYEKYSELRDHIAHSRCVGINKLEPDLIVF